MSIFDVPDLFPYPCPKCWQRRVVYDGLLVWRSGPRPPRELARKRVGFSPRADYERERIYHCQDCSAEFFQDVESSRVHLFEEGGGVYYYREAEGTWTHRFYDQAAGRFKTRVFDRAEGRWREQ